MKYSNKDFIPKPPDILILIIPIAIAVICIMMFSSKTIGKNARIIVDGEIIDKISLQKDAVYNFNLKEDNIVEVKNGKIGIKSANCKDKTCIDTGYISKSGDVICCVPSALVIVIEQDENNEFDAITR